MSSGISMSKAWSASLEFRSVRRPDEKKNVPANSAWRGHGGFGGDGGHATWRGYSPRLRRVFHSKPEMEGDAVGRLRRQPEARHVADFQPRRLRKFGARVSAQSEGPGGAVWHEDRRRHWQHLSDIGELSENRWQSGPVCPDGFERGQGAGSERHAMFRRKCGRTEREASD